MPTATQLATRHVSAAAVGAAMAAALAPRDSAADRAPVVEPWTLRRWEAGETNRLNRAHWAKATGQPINLDLAGNLTTLRARCAFEAANNPIVEGVINTHAVDLIGEDGPTLQLLTDESDFNDAAEQLWRDWFAMPDLTGQLPGCEILHQCVKLWWKSGEHLLRITSTEDVPVDALALRVQVLDPALLGTDLSSCGDPGVTLGVRRDALGRPIEYQIAGQTYSADEIIHQFELMEPGQVRGAPWLASALNTIADLRDYDLQVLDAARQAASQGVVWYTDHPDAPYVDVNEKWKAERNTERTGPPGWKPTLIDPKQPAAHYVDFRTERLRELGRARSMPLMKILLGSERHNFAAARMDNQNYQRACEALQAWTERITLNRLLRLVLREGMLLRRGGQFVLPRQPARLKWKWLWPKQPHIDPLKEANAEHVYLQNGTLPFAEACARHGRDEDEVIASRKRTAEKLAEAGLPAVADWNDSLNTDTPDEDQDANAPRRLVATA